jgi:predicted alpha/beta-fold hydrolase
MKQHSIASWLAACLLAGLVCSPCHADETKRTAAALDAPSVGDRASMQTMQIPSHGALMNALVYVAAGAGPHPAVILLHGFPGNERNLDLAQDMRRAGWDVLYFNYRGSWAHPAISPSPTASKMSPPRWPIFASPNTPRHCDSTPRASC